ncbi:MAG: Gfo/Idh/MocA family oxidoreductase [Acidimicrobiaceae bacterium]|nr:Gfo/Idh/MocA family oxidoreductase [Acidimicrobiaceae bacterium]
MEQHPGTVRWGISSTGNIASQFADAFGEAEGGQLVAVGSRSQDSAVQFAATYEIPRAHGSNVDLAADPDVDAVYVASVQPAHVHDTVMFLEAGKHVLVEKPIALNVAEVDRMTAAAQANDRFLMEAMWMRFNPAHIEAVKRISDGAIGEVRRIHADFSFSVPFDLSHRLWNLDTGGGALLDVGVYPLTFAWWILGEPAKITAAGHVAESGVDAETTLLCSWPNGATATLTCGIDVVGTLTARVEGSDGSVDFLHPAHATNTVIVQSGAEREEITESPASLHYQVDEVNRCLAAGEQQSPQMDWVTSRAMIAACDAIRAELGVRYPSD